MPRNQPVQVHSTEAEYRPKDTGEDRFSLKRFLAWFLFFFYFSGVHQAIIYFSDIADFFGLAKALVMSLLWLVPVMLFPLRARLIGGVVGVVLWASSLFSMGYLALYRQDFSQSVIFILFESNWAESSEYLQSYFAWWMLPALAVYTLIPWLLWRRLQAIGGTPLTRAVLTGLIGLAVCWPVLASVMIGKASLAEAFDAQATSMEPVAPWQLVVGYIKYRQALATAENRLLAADKPPLQGLVDSNADKPGTLVLVIGESTNSRRLGIYGYYRDTTPRLQAMSDELLIFDQVYAPRPYTVESLLQALTFADQRQPKLYLEKPTLVEVMKQAGYRTYWITNQQTQTQRNTLLTTFSKQADEQIYLNNNRSQNSAQYDEAVLRPFEQILDRPEAKKFILVHLIGTHRAYRYRYPESFRMFDDDQQLPPWVRKKRHRREYNEFDNSVLYNDFVVASLIEQLKQSGDNSAMVYFADHGEEVYDYPHKLFAGREEAAPTPAMYSVPFLLWRSESWKQSNVIDVSPGMTRRLYSLSDFIYTWTDLAGISFDGFDAGRSIISRWYTPGPVLIGDPAEPDTLADVRDKFFPALAGTMPGQEPHSLPTPVYRQVQAPAYWSTPGPTAQPASRPAYHPDTGPIYRPNHVPNYGPGPAFGPYVGKDAGPPFETGSVPLPFRER